MPDTTVATTELTVEGSTMSTLVAEPSGPPRGGVVVAQEAFGLTGHIEQVVRDLAAAGYLAVAPALFHRSGSPTFAYDDLSELGPVIAALSGEGIALDVDTARSLLGDHGIEGPRQAIIGFCMGGSIAMATAARVEIGAAVTFYGGGIAKATFGLPALLDVAPRLRTPWLGLYGDLDAHIPTTEVDRLAAAATGAGVATEVVRYPDADHGFHCADRASFHQASSADAWRRTLTFLDDHLG